MRHVPPAYSPIPPRALAAGLGALFGSSADLRVRLAARLAERYGARRVRFTDSGTTALRLSLEGAVAALRGGASVALPAFGCYDLLTALRGAGVDAVLYDVDPRTLSPVHRSLRSAVDRGAGVVVVAHLYGVPVELDRVRSLVADAEGILIEDAAQGVGAAYGGRPLGAHGSLSILSFGRGKGLTGGGGGALLAHDAAGEAALDAAGCPAAPADRGAGRLLAALAQWALGRPRWYALPARMPFLELGETVYRDPWPPADVPAACLAILDRSLEASLREAEGRRGRAGRLLELLRPVADLRAVDPPRAGRPGYLRLPVVARDGTARARLSSGAARRLGIARSYPEPLHRLAAYRAVRADDGSGEAGALRGATYLSRSLFTLPVHGRMDHEDTARIGKLIDSSVV